MTSFNMRPGAHLGVLPGGTVMTTGKGQLITQDNTGTTVVINPGPDDSIPIYESSDSNGITFQVNNFTATTAPGPTNDINQGYRRGSTWYDTVSGIVYRAVRVDAGNALWIQSGGGGSGLTFTGGLVENAGVVTVGTSNTIGTTANTVFVRSNGQPGQPLLTTTPGAEVAPGPLNLAQSGVTVTGVLTVPNGGTGASSLTSGRLLQGNGTGPITATAFSLPANDIPGGGILQSNGSGVFSVVQTTLPTNTALFTTNNVTPTVDLFTVNTASGVAYYLIAEIVVSQTSPTQNGFAGIDIRNSFKNIGGTAVIGGNPDYVIYIPGTTPVNVQLVVSGASVILRAIGDTSTYTWRASVRIISTAP